MGKASRRRSEGRHTRTSGSAPTERPAPFVARPFQGLVGETDWVAMREVVPAATATILLRDAAPPPSAKPPQEEEPAGSPELPGASGAAAAAQSATVATVLPLAWSGMRRGDGEVFVALQSGSTSGDASRDVAKVLLSLAHSEPGTPLPAAPASVESTPRLQDVLDLSAPFEVTVHDGFGFWIEDATTLDAEAQESLERANAAAVPTTKLSSVASAYWCRVGERTHLRWILAHDEDAATDALARLHARGQATLGAGTRLLGAFRACGLLVPVWDLDPAKEGADYEDAVTAISSRLDDALAVAAGLTPDERRARAGLLSRQVTLR